MNEFRVGTRGSALALAQANLVVDALKARSPSLRVRIVAVKTKGDLLPPDKRRGVDGKAAFTGELEKQLAEGGIDAAVHSYKDLPVDYGDELIVVATPLRGDPRDALASKGETAFENLPKGARIGTSSLRRRAQLLSLRRDLEIVDLHGNVETRIKRMEDSQIEGVVVAAAGLERLGLKSKISQLFDPDELVPAVCQGIIAVQGRADDEDVVSLLAGLDDEATRQASECEREFSRKLGGDCYVPLGAYARVARGDLRAVGVVANSDGTRVVKAEVRGKASEGTGLGVELAEKLLGTGGDEILRGLR